MSSARFAFLPIAFALGTGCAYRTATVHVPAPIPAMAAEQLVTDVSVASGVEPVDDEVASEVRAKATRMMLKATIPGVGAPGHVQVSVDLIKRIDHLAFLHRDGIAAPLLVFPVLAGLVIDHETIGVDVTVESGGRTFTGHGEGDKDGSLYASGLKRALAVALDRALADAAKHPVD